jgi:hypothetical protein
MGLLHPVSDLATAKPAFAALLGVQPQTDESYAAAPTERRREPGPSRCALLLGRRERRDAEAPAGRLRVLGEGCGLVLSLP